MLSSSVKVVNRLLNVVTPPTLKRCAQLACNYHGLPYGTRLQMSLVCPPESGETMKQILCRKTCCGEGKSSAQKASFGQSNAALCNGGIPPKLRVPKIVNSTARLVAKRSGKSMPFNKPKTNESTTPGKANYSTKSGGGKSLCGEGAKVDPCRKTNEIYGQKKSDPCVKKSIVNACPPQYNCGPKNDPCAKKTGKRDPCNPPKCDPKNPCGNQDPCGPKNNDPCASQKYDPCASQKNDPCAPKKSNICDPCAPKKSSDPCKSGNDPCAPKKSSSNPCDPCAPKNDPCKSGNDPCAPKKSDPCAPKKSDPCASQKSDPCASQKNDPCGSKKSDPCAPCKPAKKVDPCAPKQDDCDPCAKYRDPCNDSCSRKLPSC